MTEPAPEQKTLAQSMHAHCDTLDAIAASLEQYGQVRHARDVRDESKKLRTLADDADKAIKAHTAELQKLVQEFRALQAVS